MARHGHGMVTHSRAGGVHEPYADHAPEAIPNPAGGPRLSSVMRLTAFGCSNTDMDLLT